jgi:cysteine desulfurase
VEDCRETLASVLSVEARDVVFTSGGTEANNLALRSAPALVTSRIEHPSVVRVAEHLEQQGTPVRWLSVPASGRLQPATVAEALASLPQGAVIALMAVNHETGVLQPIAEVAQLAHAAGARLHVDAVQALGRVPLDGLQAADSVTVTAHKLRGPKGLGALAFRPGRPPRPVLLGGAQERGLRPGTVDAVAAAGFRAALLRVAESQQRYAALEPLRDRLERALAAHAEVNGTAARAPHVSNLSFAGQRGDELVAALDLAGVRVASGSACSAGTTEPSAVVLAMHGKERASGAVRVSLGEATSREHVERAIAAFIRVLASTDAARSSDA